MSIQYKRKSWLGCHCTFGDCIFAIITIKVFFFLENLKFHLKRSKSTMRMLWEYLLLCNLFSVHSFVKFYFQRTITYSKKESNIESDGFLSWFHEFFFPCWIANLPNSTPSLYKGLPYCFVASFIYKVYVHSNIIFPMWLLFIFYLLLLVIYQIP